MSAVSILHRAAFWCALLLAGLIYLVGSLLPHPSTVVVVEVPYSLWLLARAGAAYCLLHLVLYFLPELYRLGSDLLAPRDVPPADDDPARKWGW